MTKLISSSHLRNSLHPFPQLRGGSEGRTQPGVDPSGGSKASRVGKTLTCQAQEVANYSKANCSKANCTKLILIALQSPAHVHLFAVNWYTCSSSIDATFLDIQEFPMP